MKKNLIKKLLLNKSTLANLNQDNMHEVYGGVATVAPEVTCGRTCVSKCASLCCGTYNAQCSAACGPGKGDTKMDVTCPGNTLFACGNPPAR